MPLPKQRHNSSRGKRRRAGHKKLEVKKLVKCSNCGKPTMPHVVCGNCGYYKGKEVVKAKA